MISGSSSVYILWQHTSASPWYAVCPRGCCTRHLEKFSETVQHVIWWAGCCSVKFLLKCCWVVAFDTFLCSFTHASQCSWVQQFDSNLFFMAVNQAQDILKPEQQQKSKLWVSSVYSCTTSTWTLDSYMINEQYINIWLRRSCLMLQSTDYVGKILWFSWSVVIHPSL